MDYSNMLDFHKRNNCDCTIAVLEVPLDEASRFGIMNTKDDDRIYEFEEKPPNPKSNLASMGIYIFTWQKLKEMLVRDSKIHPDSDFGKHIIPAMLADGSTLYAYRFRDYWKDVGTIESYWAANMELIKTLPDFNLYEDFWKIYTSLDHQPPQYTSAESEIKTSLLSEGCEIYGSVYNSVLGPGVVVKKGAVVRDSIIMANSEIGENALIDRCVLDENNIIGENVIMGRGENIKNTEKPHIYDTGITVTGENTVIPANTIIGKNCCIYGVTKESDYKDHILESGETLIIEEEVIL
jgi:glucose-1-phosphate adenylyltransferase